MADNTIHITTSILDNPLATVEQLSMSASNDHGLPAAIEDSIRYEASQLVQAAAILLRLPQDVAAQAIVLLCRFWTGQDGASMLDHDAKDVASAALYLSTKPSGHAVYPRLLLTVFHFLAHVSPNYDIALRSESPTWTFSEGDYEDARGRLYAIEARMLRTLGFQTQVSLPHTLCVNYLQALDTFKTSDGQITAKRALELLNTALFSPQSIYLTHQPNVLAVSAIYLAARQIDVKLPETEWWEVFDVDREDLGFIVVALQSVDGFVAGELSRQRSHGALLTIEAVKQEIARHASTD